MKIPVTQGIYCSISNVLGDDTLKNKRHIIDIFGDGMAQEFLDMDYGIPSAKKFTVLCGDAELDSSTQKLPNLKVVKNTGHEFTIDYKQAVLAEIFK